MPIFAKTGERLTPEKDHSTAYQTLVSRHMFAYEQALKIIRPDFTVLEAGCGEGYGTNMLADRAAQVTGLDVDSATVKKAATKYTKKIVALKLTTAIDFLLAIINLTWSSLFKWWSTFRMIPII